MPTNEDLYRSQSALAETNTALVKAIAALEQRAAIKDVEDKYRDQKLASYANLGKLAVGAIITVSVGVILNFAFRGGFVV